LTRGNAKRERQSIQAATNSVPSKTVILGILVPFALLATAAADLAAPMESGFSTPSRLEREKSPYLREHAGDAVAWYPWGDEAFDKARRENKPVFLSVGYSTCHWCHVMERESFSNREVAAILNADFVPVLVDREERPEIDRLYLAFVESSTGSGGWPLSVWLTPDLKPFLGGTYFAPESRPGRPGFKTMLEKVSGMWGSQRDELLRDSDKMLESLVEESGAASAVDLPLASLRRRTMPQIAGHFDARDGGFGPAPKFPGVPLLEFLLDLHATSTESKVRDQALAMTVRTLQAIVAGGIHDQIGGGFHRYSVDARWRIPHFEKMLSDQAELASVLVSGWQLTGDPELKAAARDTLGYVLRTLTDPAGGFYSAEDADSGIPSRSGELGEGAFYLWTAPEVARLMGSENAAVFDYAYGIEAKGNWPTETPGGIAGANVLYRAHSPAECARKFGRREDDIRKIVEAAFADLKAAREARPRPARDDKIITAWNGLSISAFARAAQAFGDPGYSASAVHAATFLRANLFDPATGELSHSFRGGWRDNRGFAEDYSFLVQGLLDLYETTFEVRWLEWAAQLQDKQIALFWDSAHGGFFANAAGDATILLRLKDHSDGAESSANSVAVRNLSRLSEMLNRGAWLTLARATARAFSADLDRDPTALPLMTAAAGWLDGAPMQILIHGEPARPDTEALLGEVWKRYLPHHVLMRIDRESRDFFSSRLPVVADLPAEGGAAAAYVCVNFSCRLPTDDPTILAKMLTAGGSSRN
jgi:uncharacterized protein YyaL (SSP411 family)